MHCVKCGAVLADDAKFCGACGTPVGANGPAPAVPRQSNRGKIIGIVLAVLLLIFMLSQCGGDGAGTNSTAPASGAEAAAPVPATPVTARALFQAYQENEAAAQAKYGGRPLEVTGVVDGVDLDFSDEPSVKLRTDNQFMPAQASLIDADQPKAAGLTKGSTIRLRCESVGEVVGTPMLRDCRIL